MAVLFALGLITWQVKARRAEAVNLTSEDMALIAEDQSPQYRAGLAGDEKARKEFAEDIRRLLAVAEEARAKGVDKTPEMKRQLRIARAVVIAESYFKSLGGDGSKPNVTDQEVEQVFQQPANKELFDQLVADAKARNPQLASGGEIPEDQLKMFRQQLGEVLVGESKGVAAGVPSQRPVQLQIMFQQARALAQTYAKVSQRSLLPRRAGAANASRRAAGARFRRSGRAAAVRNLGRLAMAVRRGCWP